MVADLKLLSFKKVVRYSLRDAFREDAWIVDKNDPYLPTKMPLAACAAACRSRFWTQIEVK